MHGTHRAKQTQRECEAAEVGAEKRRILEIEHGNSFFFCALSSFALCLFEAAHIVGVFGSPLSA